MTKKVGSLSGTHQWLSGMQANIMQGPVSILSGVQGPASCNRQGIYCQSPRTVSCNRQGLWPDVRQACWNRLLKHVHMRNRLIKHVLNYVDMRNRLLKHVLKHVDKCLKWWKTQSPTQAWT